MIAPRIIEEGKRLYRESGSALAIVEFLRVHAGEESLPYVTVRHTANSPHDPDWIADAKEALSQWLLLAERDIVSDRGGLLSARFEAATDLMEQVERLLADKELHPAAPIMLAGAALEQALRGMVESEAIVATGRPGIGSYADGLRKADVISRQERKDIEAWAGLRNSAAHGDFNALSTDVARLMALGVNLFLQQRATV